MRLWRNARGTREGKFLVLRRDGSVPEWPYFVLGARDPAAPAALRAYAAAAAEAGMDSLYAQDIQSLADQFDRYRHEHGDGDPDAAPHRADDPEVIARMRPGVTS